MEIIIVSAISVAIIAVLMVERYERLQYINLWRDFAARHGGKFFKMKHWAGLPQDVGHVTLEKEGYVFTLDLRVIEGRENRTIFTRFQVPVSQPFALEITSATLVKRLAGTFKQDLAKSGFANFDERFMMSSDKPRWARLLISTSTHWRYYQLAEEEPVSVSLEGGKLIVEHLTMLEDEGALEAFFAFALEVAQTIDNTQPPSLEGGAGGQLTLTTDQTTDRQGGLSIASASGGELTALDD